MLKFTNHLANANLLLIKRQVGEGTCAAFVVMRSPVRRYAKEFYSEKCPPPDKPHKSRKFLYGMIGATVLTGAAIVYAKNSPEARAFLESNVPWANNVIAVVYQENTTYWEFTSNQLSKVKNAIVGFMFGKEGVTPMDFKQRSEQNLEQDAKFFYNDNKDYELPPPVLEPLYVEETVIETPDVDPPSNVIRTDKCDPPKPMEIKITKDIVELEHEMHEYTKKAIDQYKKALTACAKYTKSINEVMEKNIDELEKKHFFALQGARNERDKLLAASKEASAKAKCAIDTLERAINTGLKAPPENIVITRRYIKQFGNDIAAIEKQVKDELEKGILYDQFREKVEAARKAYNDELEALFPGVDLKAKQIDLRGDTDLLLLYTMKQVQYLQKELAEAQTIREAQLNRAIECKDEKAIIELKVDDMIRKERLQKEQEYQKKLLLAEAEAYRKMKETLKRQMDINLDVLNSRIAAKEKEILARIGRAVSEQVEKERTKFKQELAAMVGKLQAIEQTLKTRAKAEAEARKSQTLWLAAEALLAATRKQQCQTKIDNELTALEKAAGKDDKLVTTILDGIPKDVREKGIATEICLKERFDKLEKTAKKVALIGREGAALPMYFLSWLQSKLLFQKLAEIPKDELDNLPTDFTELDTFDIIHRARYHMDHGNLAHAMRYVNLLQGAPRAAACAWLEAARLHLEIRQAAEAVMAHAALSGMLK